METCMPEDGSGPRSEQLALLSEVGHEWLTSEATARLIEDAESEVAGQGPDYREAALVRVARRLHDRKARIPGDLVARMARTVARANSIWIRARADSDYKAFAPVLGEILGLCREQADALGHGGRRYDALLDLYEADLTTEDTERVFDAL